MEVCPSVQSLLQTIDLSKVLNLQLETVQNLESAKYTFSSTKYSIVAPGPNFFDIFPLN